MKKFEILDHTADIRMKIYGKNLAELFKNSGDALFSLIVRYAPGRPVKKEIYLQALNLEDLLVFWINELIALFYAYKFLPGRYNKIELGNYGNKKTLRATVTGKNFNPYGSKVIQEIKAATYHGVKIEQTEKMCAAEVIFDV